MADIDSLINEWSESLSERLVEIRFVDIAQMKAAMNVHLKSALYDCIKCQLPDTEKKLIEAKEKYINNYGRGNNNHIQAEIVSLKKKLKEQNKLHADLEKIQQFEQVKIWMNEKYPELLKEFYDYFRVNFQYRTGLNKYKQLK